MKRKLPLIMVVAFILIIMLNQRWLMPFLVSGLPVQLVQANQSTPISFSEALTGTSDSWTVWNYRAVGERKYYDTLFNLYGRYVKIEIAIDLYCGISIYDVSTPVKVFEVEPKTGTKIATYRYTFKANIVWTGVITITEKEKTEWGWLPAGAPTYADLVKMIIKEDLIPDFNPDAFFSGNVIYYIDSQVLAGALATSLKADAYGTIGLFLDTHSADGLVSGTFNGVPASSKAYATPSTAGTVISRYSDSGLSVNQYTVSSTSYSAELSAGFVDEFAVRASPSSYFKIAISSLGSQLAFNDAGTYPKFVQFVYEAAGAKQPAIKQQYRVDVGFKIPVAVAPPPTPPPAPAPKYTYNVLVKDQVGNSLPATVQIDQQIISANIKGEASFTTTESKTYSIRASVKVGEKEYSASKTVTLAHNMTDTIVINRRFLWKFDVSYSDGTKPTGTLTLTGNKETLTASVKDGHAEAYLLDDTYALTLTASPQVSLGKITVTNDGSLDVVIQKETDQITTFQPQTYTPETTPYVAPTVPVAPEIPWILLPTTNIYILTAILVIIGLIAIYVRRR